MARTLSGEEWRHPYSIRGDVSQASIIDKEEAYGAIGDSVAHGMFGAVKRPLPRPPPRRGFRAARIPISQMRLAPTPSGMTTAHGGRLQSANAYSAALVSFNLLSRFSRSLTAPRRVLHAPWAWYISVPAASGAAIPSYDDRVKAIAKAENVSVYRVANRMNPGYSWVFTRHLAATKPLGRGKTLFVAR